MTIMADLLTASLLRHLRLPLVWLSVSTHMRNTLNVSLSQVLLFSGDDLGGYSSRQRVSILLSVLHGRQNISLYRVSILKI